MLASAWLKQSEARLKEAGVPTARLDTLVLLEDATSKDRAWLLAHPELELAAEVENSLDAKLNQRAQHIPLAYIRGRAEFYGRTFKVSEHTLVPRPETETMIELLRDTAEHSWQQMGGALVIDIGTGSGAIAITAKLEFPEAQVIATDIDENCLKIARENAARLRAGVSFLHGNLLEPFARRPAAFNSPFSILLCNLPYVPDDFAINTAATHEPRHALFGGADGLDLYRELFAQITAADAKPFYLFTEALPPQHETLADIAHAAGYALQQTSDFIQFFQRS